MLSSPVRRMLSRVLAVAVAASCLGWGAAATVPAAQAATVNPSDYGAYVFTAAKSRPAWYAPSGQAAVKPSADDSPFSDPVWLPVKTAAWVSCAYENCLGTKAGHLNGTTGLDYWAIDFISKVAGGGDPVVASGGGIAHIGNSGSAACAAGGDTDGEGNWVWIDHGGVYTRYHHLKSISITEGQVVEPGQKIGTIGNSGANPCSISYLHFEVIVNGYLRDVGAGEPTRPRVDFGPLAACTSGGNLVYYPQALGVTSWDDVTPYFKVTGVINDPVVESSGTSCGLQGRTSQRLATPGSTTENKTKVTVTWGEPLTQSGDPDTTVTGVVVSVERMQPSVNKYAFPVYTRLAPSRRSLELTRLTPGLKYRVTVAYRNAVGTAQWSQPVEVVPMEPPDPPVITELKATLAGLSVSYLWNSDSMWNGTPATGFEIDMRSCDGDVCSDWATTTVGSTTRYKRWDNPTPGLTYEVRVRALSIAGPSESTAVASTTVSELEAPAAPTVRWWEKNPAETFLRFGWQKPPNPAGAPVTGFELQVRTRPNGGTWPEWPLEATPLDVGTVSTTWDDPTPGTDYQVRVRAVNVAGTSDWLTKTMSFTPLRGPSAPGWETVVGRKTLLRINWLKPTSIDPRTRLASYEIALCQLVGTTCTWQSRTGPITTTVYEFSGLKPGATYRARVRAVTTPSTTGEWSTARTYTATA